jgi:RNA polymerase sigma-70 factor (ECF subfamily)
MHMQTSLKYRTNTWRRMTDERTVTPPASTAEVQLTKRAPDTQSSPAPGALPVSGIREASDAGVDREALAALIEKEYVGLRLLIARKAEDPQLGADLLNEAICTTWEKWQNGQIARPQQIAGYVFQVAMNLLRNHRRGMGVRPEKRASASELDGLQAKGEPRDELIESDLATRVKTLIRDMGSERDRSVLVRFYLDEEDKEIICRDLNLTPLQFDKVLHRARRRLKELLEARGLSKSDLLSLVML